MKNVMSAGKTRQQPTEERGLWSINEDVEENFNTVRPSAIFFQKPVRVFIIVFTCILVWSGGGSLRAEEYLQLPGVIHVHTSFSSGKYHLEELVDKAKVKGLEVLIPTDHDLVVMEYGLFPLQNLIKKREERKSILQAGPDVYLAEIERLNRSQQDVLILPGAQSSPFYYWSGSPFRKNLTAHDYRKEILLVGLDSAEDYRELPLLHRGFSTRYVKSLLPRTVILLMSFLTGVVLALHKGFYRGAGFFVVLISALLLINHHPFQSSRFDPYHGDQGVGPYQEVIDYVSARGGLAFWAHPESNYSKNGVRIGPVVLKTEHYAETLGDTHKYTGFSAIYGDRSTAANPGGQWDRVLIEYCNGVRDAPVYAIAGADFHEEKKGVELDTYRTVFLVKEKRAAAVLDALRTGKTYAVLKPNDAQLELKRFQVSQEGSTGAARSGEELRIRTQPVVDGLISASDGCQYEIRVKLIRSGILWQEFAGRTPLSFRFIDQNPKPGKSFYRLEVSGRAAGRLISNPIFVYTGTDRSVHAANRTLP